MKIFQFINKKDDLLYEYVFQEIDITSHKSPVKSLWAKSLAYSDGETQKANSYYIKLRVKDIKESFKLLKIPYNKLSKEDLWKKIEKINLSYDEKKILRKKLDFTKKIIFTLSIITIIFSTLYIYKVELIAIPSKKIANNFFDNKEYQNAIKFYSIASNCGDDESIFKLAFIYNKLKKYNKSIFYYKKYLTKKEWSGAMHNLSRVYMLGKKEYKQAIYWAKKGLNRGSKYGYFEIAYSYDELKNYKKARFWYEQSILKNNEKIAMWNLAIIYEKGLGNVAINKKRAFILYLKSAKLGYKKAYKKVASFYIKGIGTEKDLKKAKYWLHI